MAGSNKKFIEEAHQRVREKFRLITEQRDAIYLYIDEVYGKAQNVAGKLLAEKDKLQFMHKFRPVMGELEESLNTLFVIQASLPTEDADGDNSESVCSALDPCVFSGVQRTASRRTPASSKADSRTTSTSGDQNSRESPVPNSRGSSEPDSGGSSVPNSRKSSYRDSRESSTSKSHETAHSQNTADRNRASSKSDFSDHQNEPAAVASLSSADIANTSKVDTREKSADIANSDPRARGDGLNENQCSKVREKTAQLEGCVPAIERLIFEKNDRIEVFVTEVISPSLFFVQPQSPLLEDLMDRLGLYHSRIKVGESEASLGCKPVAGMVVSAEYESDHSWYRARITSVSFNGDSGDSERCEMDVFYIDYGNREFCLGLDRVRKLPIEFTKLPAFAFPCALSKTGPIDDSGWTMQVCMKFANMVLNGLTMLQIMGKVDGYSVVLVELFSSPHSSQGHTGASETSIGVSLQQKQGRRVAQQEVIQYYLAQIHRSPINSSVSSLDDKLVYELQSPDIVGQSGCSSPEPQAMITPAEMHQRKRRESSETREYTRGKISESPNTSNYMEGKIRESPDAREYSKGKIRDTREYRPEKSRESPDTNENLERKIKESTDTKESRESKIRESPDTKESRRRKIRKSPDTSINREGKIKKSHDKEESRDKNVRDAHTKRESRERQVRDSNYRRESCETEIKDSRENRDENVRDLRSGSECREERIRHSHDERQTREGSVKDSRDRREYHEPQAKDSYHGTETRERHVREHHESGEIRERYTRESHNRKTSREEKITESLGVVEGTDRESHDVKDSREGKVKDAHHEGKRREGKVRDSHGSGKENEQKIRDSEPADLSPKLLRNLKPIDTCTRMKYKVPRVSLPVESIEASRSGHQRQSDGTKDSGLDGSDDLVDELTQANTDKCINVKCAKSKYAESAKRPDLETYAAKLKTNKAEDQDKPSKSETRLERASKSLSRSKKSPPGSAGTDNFKGLEKKESKARKEEKIKSSKKSTSTPSLSREDSTEKSTSKVSSDSSYWWNQLEDEKKEEEKEKPCKKKKQKSTETPSSERKKSTKREKKSKKPVVNDQSKIVSSSREDAQAEEMNSRPASPEGSQPEKTMNDLAEKDNEHEVNLSDQGELVATEGKLITEDVRSESPAECLQRETSPEIGSIDSNECVVTPGERTSSPAQEVNIDEDTKTKNQSKNDSETALSEKGTHGDTVSDLSDTSRQKLKSFGLPAKMPEKCSLSQLYSDLMNDKQTTPNSEEPGKLPESSQSSRNSSSSTSKSDNESSDGEAQQAEPLCSKVNDENVERTSAENVLSDTRESYAELTEKNIEIIEQQETKSPELSVSEFGNKNNVADATKVEKQDKSEIYFSDSSSEEELVPIVAVRETVERFTANQTERGAGRAKRSRRRSNSNMADFHQSFERQKYKQLDVLVPSDGCLTFLMSYIISPAKFWIHLVSEGSSRAVDSLMVDLNKYYKSANCVILQKYFDNYEPQVHDICCARFTEDDAFYRAEIVAVHPDPKTKVKVFYVDYGNSEWVFRERVFPLPPKFVDIPAQAIFCSLAGVSPVRHDAPDVMTSERKQGDRSTWNKAAVKTFAKLTGFDDILLGYVTDRELDRTISLSSSDTSLPLVVVNTRRKSDVWIHEELIRLGYGHSEALPLIKKDKYNEFDIPDKKVEASKSKLIRDASKSKCDGPDVSLPTPTAKTSELSPNATPFKLRSSPFNGEYQSDIDDIMCHFRTRHKAGPADSDLDGEPSNNADHASQAASEDRRAGSSISRFSMRSLASDAYVVTPGAAMASQTPEQFYQGAALSNLLQMPMGPVPPIMPPQLPHPMTNQYAAPPMMNRYPPSMVNQPMFGPPMSYPPNDRQRLYMSPVAYEFFAPPRPMSFCPYTGRPFVSQAQQQTIDLRTQQQR